MQGVQQQGAQGHVSSEPIRRRISAFLTRSIQRFRFVLLGLLIVGAAFFLGYIIYGEINKKLVSDSTTLAEAAQAAFTTWQTESDASKKTAEEKDLRTQLDTVIKRYPRQYGAQRGLFLRAEINFGTKAWDAARKDYEALASRFSNSYLAPVGLFNAAVCAEETGDLAGAAKLYARVYTGYKDSTVAPRALFDSGRVAESQSSWTDAQKAYEQLDSQYGQSVWDKLAKNRIIELKVEGKIK
jgi:TolA-binding protein